jgi:hypothetical protein
MADRTHEPPSRAQIAAVARNSHATPYRPARRLSTAGPVLCDVAYRSPPFAPTRNPA